MRLKAIKLAGFKSFVDPTTVPFATNMTGIVGPNGCGKSNTIDAVRWVMGESSAKYLRGDAMTDVIFNGSAERKPVGKASVELIFDNSDKTLKGEYAAYNEISLRRQVTRDGQSLYFLNGAKCRRKDITDIFLGTGLGPRSYAIIEQGMISRLIEAKPEELRIYVEEAAGISKYKERRRETENRIARTRENLERLEDIRQELERQLGHLQRQAAAAEKYKEYKAQEREKKAQLQALKWQALDGDYKERELAIARFETAFEGQIAKQRAVDAQIEGLRQDHFEKSEQFNQAQNKYYEVGAQIARQEQKIEHQAQMSLQLDRELGEVEKSLFDAERALENDQLKQEMHRAELEHFAPELELMQAQREDQAMALLEAQEAQEQGLRDWESFTARASEPTKKAEVAQTKMQATEQQLARVAGQIRRLEDELSALAHNPEQEEIRLLSEELSEQELQAESAQEQLENLQAQVAHGREALEQLRSQYDQGKSQLAQQRTRQATLQALQKAALGQSNEAVGHWLESHQLARKARLAEQIQVQAGWEIAVETVLGNFLHAVMLDDVAQAAPWLDSFKAGELVLWQQQNQSPSASANSLLAKVSCRQDLSVLLGKVKVATDLPQALALRAQLSADESVITPDGLWLSKNWLRVSKQAANEGGVLARQQELELLDEQIEELDIQVEEWEVDLNSAKLRLANLEQQRDQAARAQQPISQRLMQLKSQLSGKQARAEQFALRSDKLKTDIKEQQELQSLERENLEELRMQWQEAMSHIDSDSSERERLQKLRQDAQQRLDAVRQQEQDLRQRSHALELKVQGLKSQEAGLNEAIARLAAQIAQAKQRKNQIQANQKQDHSADLDELKLALEEMLERRLQAEQHMQGARQALEQVDSHMRELEGARAQAELKAQEVRNELERVRMECQALDIRRQALIENLAEEKLSLKEVLEAMPEEANAEEWQEELARIGERISRLGAINLAAIDEYKVQSERQAYLEAQHNDLTKALNTLEGAIAKIDGETRTRFKETFDKMNAGLAELFPKVFGGGHAWLELTEEDMLNTGVAIMARPPGKKNSTIHLLSGGEKALTAIALVFSIFQLNPAPFCMLDEVDAPLDDANVGRYARLVKAMSEKVQFIYITHNKIAMEQASQLMGVTMHEPGVSRLVSVDIEEAVQMVES
ncbi:MAG: hypothetical protein RL217_974 [Pseudomonadota bacterium]|jgi:chromosome segregation protein